MKFLYFFLIVGVGFTSIYFAYPLYKILGRFDWVEKYLGSGGTISFWRLIGVAIIIFAFIFVTYF
ncbi:MAG: hypothetical protein PHH45_02290 [Patescibacteria group bacterium]|jgi:hypothetical protein|nr:hypothetical protein [Patescibacteria group bacterium]